MFKFLTLVVLLGVLLSGEWLVEAKDKEVRGFRIDGISTARGFGKRQDQFEMGDSDLRYPTFLYLKFIW